SSPASRTRRKPAICGPISPSSTPAAKRNNCRFRTCRRGDTDRRSRSPRAGLDHANDRAFAASHLVNRTHKVAGFAAGRDHLKGMDKTIGIAIELCNSFAMHFVFQGLRHCTEALHAKAVAHAALDELLTR